MARTRDAPRENTRRGRKSTEPVIPAGPSSMASKRAGKTAPKDKRPNEKDNITAVELEQPSKSTMTEKANATATKTKRPRGADDTVSMGSEQPGPMKKPKTTTTKSQKAQGTPPGRRSVRNQTKIPEVTQKRKRRTKAEIEADKAKAKEEKRQKDELIKANNLAMEQMDISEDLNRKGTAARTIQKLSDLERSSQSGGEEFIGYDEASGSEDELDSDGERVDDTRKLKVRFQC